MKRDKAIWITLLVLILAFLLFIFLRKDEEKFKWYKTFESSSFHPYDFGIFESLIQKEGKNRLIIIKESLNQYLDTNITGQTYFFAGSNCYLRTSEIDSLLAFAKAGNQLVFIAEGLPSQLLEFALADEKIQLETYYQNKVSVKLNQAASLKLKGRNLFQYRSFNKDSFENTNWNYFQFPKNNLFFEYVQPQYDILGTIDSNVNFIRIYYGKGEIYIHSNPILFTNYALRNERGFDYVNHCLNSIQISNVLYDFSSRIYKRETDVLMKQSETPLSFILSKPSLKWAWYLSLLSLILFLFFVIKRKQRQIPVLEQKNNTTMGFIETLSALNFSHDNSYQMAEQKMQLFLYFLRTKLGISTLDIKADEVKLIAKKSKVNEKIVERIFDYYFQVIDYKKEKVTILI